MAHSCPEIEMGTSEAVSAATRSELGPPTQVPRESLKSAARHSRNWCDSRERPAQVLTSSAGVGVDGDTPVRVRESGSDLSKMGAAGKPGWRPVPLRGNSPTSVPVGLRRVGSVNSGRSTVRLPVDCPGPSLSATQRRLAGSIPARQQEGGSRVSRTASAKGGMTDQEGSGPPAANFPYTYAWGPRGKMPGAMSRKGEPCRVLARGRMNSALVGFADGLAVVSRSALRRRVCR